MTNTDHDCLTSDHAPYEAFWEGFVDYRDGLDRNPYGTPAKSTEARHWDRGRRAALRIARARGKDYDQPRAA